MAAIGALAVRYWWALAIAALTVALAVQSARLDNAKRDQLNPKTGVLWKVEARRDGGLLTAAVRDLGRCRANVGTLNGSLATQNAAVARWRGEAEKMEARAAEASRAALTAARAAERRAGAILAAKPGADVCQSADALILGSPEMKRIAIVAFGCVLGWTMLTAGSCATTGAPPEPKIVTREVQVPVPVYCRSTLPAEPVFPDTDAALRAAANLFERAKLLLAGRELREADRVAARQAHEACIRPRPDG